MPATRAGMRMPGLYPTVVALMVVAAGVGLLLPDVYRDASSGAGLLSRAFWRGIDAATLVVMVPFAVVAARRARGPKASRTAAVVSAGAMAYATYCYSFYLFGAVMNWLFPVYVAIVGLSAATLARTVTAGAVPTLGFGAGRRGWAWAAGFLVFVAVAITAVWTSSWAAEVGAGTSGDAQGRAVQDVAALDLLLLVTPLAVTAVGIVRRRGWAPSAALVVAVAGGGEMLALCPATIANGVAGDGVSGELGVYGVIAVGFALVGAAVLRAQRVHAQPAMPVRALTR